MSKLAIIGGAGGLGSTMAFFLGLKNRFDHISLIGRRLNMLETHLIDLRECFGEETSTTVSGGGFGELDGADLVIMAGASLIGSVTSRDEYLRANLELVRLTAREIGERAPGATLVSCTSPVDAFAMVYFRELGWDRHRLLGFCRNDSQRFRHMAARVLGLNPADVGGLVLGEHGETQVPLFSTLTHEGRPLPVNEAQKAEILALLKSWYRHWQDQDSKRTTTWTSATGMWRTLTALGLVPGASPGGEFAREGEPAMGSVMVEGEYGLRGVALGLPLTPGPLGWGRVIELDLWPGELEALRASAGKVMSLYALCA
ncbi:MAG: hypothetical protein LBF58_04405 [Deltaproteobacteria bacterium]|jgi:L-lactate dehydrogenase/malate dehydrogenase|nr:hypothetical protein [Deltaproteobacteria bacterium]